jgi:hypothetical protein
MTSRGRARPWIIEAIFLFDAQEVSSQLETQGVRIGIASSVRKRLWEQAEIFPNHRYAKFIVSEEQEKQLSTLPVESLPKKQESQPVTDRCASVGMTCNSRSLSTMVATCRPKSVK